MGRLKNYKQEGRSKLNYIKQQMKVDFENKYSLFKELDKDVKKSEPKLKSLIKFRKTFHSHVVKNRISEKVVKETINHYSRLYFGEPMKPGVKQNKGNKKLKQSKICPVKKGSLFLKSNYGMKSSSKEYKLKENKTTFIKLLNNNFRSKKKRTQKENNTLLRF